MHHSLSRMNHSTLVNMTMKSDVKERYWLCSEVEMRVEAACIFFGSVYK